MQHLLSHWRRFSVALIIMTGSCLQVGAQTYSIDWFSIDGGGGTSTGGVYSVSGSIGQPDAGTLSGGPYTLVGGFWSIVAAIQTPGAPLLSVDQETTSGQVTVSWPLPADGFLLQESSTLDVNPVPWMDVAPPYQTNTTDIFITIPAPSGTRFYRLTKP